MNPETQTPRTDAAIADFKEELRRLAPTMKLDHTYLLVMMVQLVASSAIIDHLSQQGQSK